MNEPARTTGGRTVSGFAWTAGGFGVQAVAQFAVLALLARFLTPTEFGLVSAALVVIGLVRIVTDALVGPAVTQLPDLTDDHVRSAFSLSVYIGAGAAVLMWLSSGAVAGLFAMSDLRPVVAGLSPVLLVDALSTVPIALMQRDLAFRRLAVVEASSFLIGYAGVGCTLAVAGAGVWALVLAQLAYAALRSVLTLAVRPHARSVGISWPATAEVLRFGAGHTLGRLFNYGALQGDYFVVGRWLSVGSLGIYGRAYQLAVKPAMYLGQAVDKVIFPVMASIQTDRPRLAEAYRRTISLAASISAPAAVLGVVLGPEIVRVVLGPGWDGVVVPFQVLAAGLVARTGYKPSDSLAKASGHVYRRAWRQALYATLVFGGALVGSQWGLPAVAGFVLLAIVVNYGLMADLSLRVLGMRWSTFAGAHARGLTIASLTAAVSIPVATWLRAAGAPPVAIVVVAPAAVAVVGALLLRLFDPVRVLGPDLLWLLARVQRRDRRTPRSSRRGGLVVVVGADGSGKSRLTADLVEDLGDAGGATRLYLGSGDGPAAWYRAPLKRVRDAIQPVATRKQAPPSADRRTRPAVTALRAVWAVTLALEKVGKTRDADRSRRAGTLVVCDRYPQTQFPGGNDGPLLHAWTMSRSSVLRGIAAWEARAYARATAVVPDLALKLDVTVPVALSRRAGLDPGYLEERIALVRDLDLRCPTVRLDATRPYVDVRREAVDAILLLVADSTSAGVAMAGSDQRRSQSARWTDA